MMLQKIQEEAKISSQILLVFLPYDLGQDVMFLSRICMVQNEIYSECASKGSNVGNVPRTR